jgi:hypothetical protein
MQRKVKSWNNIGFVPRTWIFPNNLIAKTWAQANSIHRSRMSIYRAIMLRHVSPLVIRLQTLDGSLVYKRRRERVTERHRSISELLHIFLRRAISSSAVCLSPQGNKVRFWHRFRPPFVLLISLDKLDFLRVSGVLARDRLTIRNPRDRSRAF